MKALMISDEVHARLKAEAKRRGMIMAALLESIVEKWLDKEAGK